MARGAGLGRVGTREHKPRRAVVEGPFKPYRRDRMTCFAVRAEPHRPVRRRRRRLVLRPVATVAIRRHRHVLVFLFVHMARTARRRQMPAHQRKARLRVTLRHIRHQPRLGTVTPLAVRPQLAPVNILVTIRTPGRRAGKDQRPVALLAGYRRVLARQRKLGLPVIEFHRTGQLCPGRRRVAVLARDRQLPMWRGLTPCLTSQHAGCNEKEPSSPFPPHPLSEDSPLDRESFVIGANVQLSRSAFDPVTRVSVWQSTHSRGVSLYCTRAFGVPLSINL